MRLRTSPLDPEWADAVYPRWAKNNCGMFYTRYDGKVYRISRYSPGWGIAVLTSNFWRHNAFSLKHYGRPFEGEPTWGFERLGVECPHSDVQVRARFEELLMEASL